MTKKIRIAVSALLLMTLAIVMASCGSKTETGTYTGKLTQALEDSLIVTGSDGNYCL